MQEKTPEYSPKRLPVWLRRCMPADSTYQHTEEVINSLGVETVCVNADCTNRGECWSRGAATVLILGNICTRRCRFCSVPKGRPGAVDASEPARVAEMARRMGLRYLVITSVDRDDLGDGGASVFRDVIKKVRGEVPGIGIEILTGDFRGCQDEAVEILREVMPFVFAHNVETVPALYRTVRPGADYARSLGLLEKVKKAYGDVVTKSSLMVGLGETDDEIDQVLKDLRGVGCERLTIGQYLRPDGRSLEVARYVRPEQFARWKERALELGFGWVISQPYARSSYLADEPTMV